MRNNPNIYFSFLSRFPGQARNEKRLREKTQHRLKALSGRLNRSIGVYELASFMKCGV